MRAAITIVVVFAVLIAGVLVLNRPRRVAVHGVLPADFPPHGFPHDEFERLLQRYVGPHGDVDYAAWHADPDSIAALDRYVAAVARFSPDTTPERFVDRQDRLAYWIYGYNAHVIRAILGHWPIDSVTAIKAPLEAVTGLGFFFRLRFPFGGKYFSLLAVENTKIRKRFQDPRIHFVLNCASGSCPSMRPELPTGPDLEELLASAALDFITDANNVAVDHESRQIVLSTIFKWFRRDFVNYSRLHGVPDSKSAVDYIRSIAPRSLATELAQAADYDIVYRNYDWTLNSV